ncbi:MAG: AmmeMemoRadiSam system radical SAM enzyme, partial [Elusimicrobiota bacterium]
MEKSNLYQALNYEPLENNKVRCKLCSHYCSIAPEKYGMCGVRINSNGILYTLTFGRAVSIANDPIEKKPLFHFYPGSRSLSLATFGCNFKCEFCQNHSISQVRNKIHDIFTPPEHIIKMATHYKCHSISYTYSEPIVFYEYAYTIGVTARENNIKNVFVTNGFMSPETIEHAKFFLDAANVDLKFFNNETYKTLCGGALEPVLHSIKMLYNYNIWIEITTLIIPGINDSEKELTQIAEFISSVSPNIPWHISRFHPDYKMLDREWTSLETLNNAYRIAKRVGLKYIFLGNVPGDPSENTFCPNCKSILIERCGYHIVKNSLHDNLCPK